MQGAVLLGWILTEAAAAAVFLNVLFRHGVRSWMVPYAMYVLAPLTMAPFAYDEANRQAVGLHFEAILGALDGAVLLTCAGLWLFGAGALWANVVQRPKVSSGLTAQLVSTWDRQIWSPSAFWLLFGISMVLTAALVVGGVPFGSGLSEAFAGTGIRPVMNAWQSVFSLSIPFCLCFVLYRPGLLRIVAVIVLCLASFYTGQRTVSLINMALGGGAYLAFRNDGNLTGRGKLLVVAAVVALFLSSAIVYQVRTGGEFDLGLAFTSVYGDFAYGNQFSDIRDLAWVLSGYDHEPLNGLTYLAGALSPFTSADSPLRAEYGIGRWTLWTAGLDTNAHGGLRMPFLSEIYFNFGMLGLVLIAPVLGYLTVKIVRTARLYTVTFHRGPSAELLCALILFLARDVIYTSAMFRVYVVVAIVVGVYLMNATLFRAETRAAPRVR